MKEEKKKIGFKKSVTTLTVKDKISVISLILLSLSFSIYLTYDIVMTNIFSNYYCNQDPNLKTFISKKVENPESIYWEDNVYPGFSKEDRELMIINYLNGKNLKIMALNGDDNKVYVYSANENDYEKIIKNSVEKNTYKKYQEYAKFIMQNEKIYTKDTMPKTNYSVTFNEVKLPSLVSKFLYSDETKVIENSTNEVVAFNKKYMRFFYKLFPDIALGNIYYPYPMCGKRVDHLEYNLFDAYKWSNMHLGNHKRDLHEILIKRNIEEK